MEPGAMPVQCSFGLLAGHDNASHTACVHRNRGLQSTNQSLAAREPSAGPLIGVSRPLLSESTRPHSSPNSKVMGVLTLSGSGRRVSSSLVQCGVTSPDGARRAAPCSGSTAGVVPPS